MTEEEINTTDFKKCRENGVRRMMLRYLTHIGWEKLDTEELTKLYILIGNELESYCRKYNLYDCENYDCPHYSEKIDPDNDPHKHCSKKEKKYSSSNDSSPIQADSSC